VCLRAVGQVDALAATLDQQLVQRPVSAAEENLTVVLLGVVTEPAVAQADAEPLNEAGDRAAKAMGAEPEALDLPGQIVAKRPVTLALVMERGLKREVGASERLISLGKRGERQRKPPDVIGRVDVDVAADVQIPIAQKTLVVQGLEVTTVG
jgi:hypothetical protein